MSERSPRGEGTDAESIRTLREALRVFASRPGPKLIATTAGTMWALRATLGPPGLADVAAAGAAVAWWPFQEWLMHKHLLHMEPRKVFGLDFDPLFARKHRAHHRNPKDVDGTLLPPSVIASAIPGASAAWLMLIGPRRAAVTAMATYSSMALFYEWTHFIVHTGVTPKTAYGKRVRRSHRLHHFRSEQQWFGFTLPEVDTWLGTDPDPASVPRSKTAMDLHGLDAAARAAIDG
ncbi:MAG: sterol desaturase family protein [Myxococcota bacterium]|nr:sterol desaturase family protein [Myxococcota bacterium]